MDHLEERVKNFKTSYHLPITTKANRPFISFLILFPYKFIIRY